MSFLDQMKLPGLINIGLLFIMASNSKGEGWSVTVDTRINATRGGDVIIPCTYTIPAKYHTKDAQVTWRNRDHAFIFHPEDSNVIKEYKERTKLIGNITARNCSLQISNVTKDEPNIYLRVFVKDLRWSFKKKEELVSIVVHRPGVPSFTSKPDITAQTQPLATSETVTVGLQSSSTYMAIFIPVAVIVVILFVTGLVFYIRHKRSQSFTREESGYYANFSRASSNQAEREASCNKQENKKLPEMKAIDEPIYINTEAPPGQMDQSMDDMDNVYANVDYTK